MGEEGCLGRPPPEKCKKRGDILDRPPHMRKSLYTPLIKALNVQSKYFWKDEKDGGTAGTFSRRICWYVHVEDDVVVGHRIS